jgi:asparagine synthase (glutamine-hydrolysing)
MIHQIQSIDPRPTLRSPWVLFPQAHTTGRPRGDVSRSDAAGWTLLSRGGHAPAGLRWTDAGWSLITPPFSHASAWYAATPEGTIRALGSDPATVAHAIGAPLDVSALVDDLLLGFRPDGRPPFEGVLPCGSAHELEYTPGGVARSAGVPEASLDAVGASIARAMDRGACIELTGGVDSRLLLALGLAAGGRPAKAFTIGAEGDPDVRVARQIAESLGMEHRRITVQGDDARVVEDTTAFVRQSGYVCNAAAYGWLPTIFRTLAPWREAQLSGVGGEIGEGFYYTGLDPIFEKLNSPRLWLRARAVVDGGRWADLFEPGAFKERLHRVAAERQELRAPGPWRMRTDDFYTHARIHGWAIPVIRASAAWYEPVTPFLSGEYLAWARSLSAEQRHARAAQREAIERSAPALAAIPYASELSGPSGSKIARKAAKARRLVSRVLPRPNAQPERWAATAGSLMRSLDGADSVVDRLRTLPGVRGDRVADVLRSDPRTAAHAIGALLTIALAIERHGQNEPDGLWQD